MSGAVAMEDALAWGRRVLASQPFSVLLEAELLAVCRCDVYVSSGGDETLCATAQGTIARLGRSSESEA